MVSVSTTASVVLHGGGGLVVNWKSSAINADPASNSIDANHPRSVLMGQTLSTPIRFATRVKAAMAR